MKSMGNSTKNLLPRSRFFSCEKKKLRKELESALSSSRLFTYDNIIRDKYGNHYEKPTAMPKSYWEPGSQDPTQFPRLVVAVV